jgi:hypothetical protein
MAAWAVEQHRWRPATANRFELFKPPVIERIRSMFEALNTSAIRATATLDESLFRTGEIDSTDDIPAMARADLIWSMSATFILGTLILELSRHKQEVGTIDIHFDPKSLKSAHSEAWKKTLRQLVVNEARRFSKERGFRHLMKLKVRRVEPVAKASGGRSPDKFQMGTWIADKICSWPEESGAVKDCPRIHTHDMSDSIRRTTQQFDGKSFYTP